MTAGVIRSSWLKVSNETRTGAGKLLLHGKLMLLTLGGF